jgi:hypothetical protein
VIFESPLKMAVDEVNSYAMHGPTRINGIGSGKKYRYFEAQILWSASFFLGQLMTHGTHCYLAAVVPLIGREMRPLCGYKKWLFRARSSSPAEAQVEHPQKPQHSSVASLKQQFFRE